MRWSLKHGDSECYKWSRRQTNCLIIAYDVFFSSFGSKREQILRCKDLIIVLCHYCSYISWIIVKTAASSKNYFPLQDIKASSLGTKEKKNWEGRNVCTVKRSFFTTIKHLVLTQSDSICFETLRQLLVYTRGWHQIFFACLDISLFSMSFHIAIDSEGKTEVNFIWEVWWFL